MDRRSFIKLFGATAAATAASTALAGLPEAVPKIALIEPKDIITDISADVWQIRHVIAFSKTVNENLRTQGDYVFLGHHEVTLQADVYMEDVHGAIAIGGNHLPFAECVTFPYIEALHGEIYRISEYTVSASSDTYTRATIHGIRVKRGGMRLDRYTD